MAATTSPVITQSNVQTEVLDTNGKNFPDESPLASIFEKIEGGQKAKDAIKEVMTPDDEQKAAAAKAASDADEASAKAAADKKAKDEEALAEKQDEKTGLDQQLTDDAAKRAEAAKSKDDTHSDAVKDEDLKVLQSDKPKTAKRIQALLSKIEEANSVVATTRKEADDRAAKLKELEDKLANVKTVDPKTDEAVKQSLEELAMYRRRYELEKDPEVKTKFDDRVADLDKQIPAILTKNRAGDALVKLINDEGGWLKFSQSSLKVPLDDGKVVEASELADMIVKALPFADRKAIDSITMEQIQTKRDRDRYFQEQERTANDYFKKRDDEFQRGSAEAQQRVKEATDMINKWHQETTSKTEWLKLKEVPSGATPEIKTAIEDENKHIASLNEDLKKAMAVKDIPGMLEVVRDSVQLKHQLRVNSQLGAENKKLTDALSAKQSELDKFKSAGRSTQRAGSIAGSSAAPVREEKPKSLEEELDRILMGKNE